MKQKNIADLMLLVSFLLFALSLIARKLNPASLGVQLCYTAAEAALIGGIADWFAVTALFSKPFGFGWHTDLISRNRQRIIQALANAVENELLSVEAIKQHLDRMHFVPLFIAWVEHQGGRDILLQGLFRYLRQAMEGADAGALARAVDEKARTMLREHSFFSYIRRLLQYYLASPEAPDLTRLLLTKAHQWLARDAFRQELSQRLAAYRANQERTWYERALLWLGERTDAVNFDDAATALQQELLVAIEALQDAQHPVRLWINQCLAELADSPSEEWEQAYIRWQADLADRVQLEGVLEQFVQALLTAAAAQLDTFARNEHAPRQPAALWAVDQARRYWKRFLADKAMQDWVDQVLRRAIYHMVETEHHLVGDVVQAALTKFSDTAFSDFVRARAGDDLQWIRINGSLVGGLVGMLLFAAIHFVYEPYVAPLIRQWFT